MRNKIKFSIITVCYNCEDIIEKTLESVVSQNYENFEYIIVDGKSSDGTFNIINEFRTKRHQDLFIISEHDKGIYDAMNKGITNANGQYIFFLNAGDTFYNNEVLLNVKEILDDESIDIFYGDIVQDIGTSKKNVKSISKLKNIHLLMDRMICHQAIFAKKESLANMGGFNTNYKIAADYNWLISCFKKKLIFKHSPILISNYDMNGISTNSHMIIQNEHEIIIREHYGSTAYLFSKFKHKVGNFIRMISSNFK